MAFHNFVARTILDGGRRNHYIIVPSVEMSAAARAASLIEDWQFTVPDQPIGRARREQEHPRRQK
jgi:hypothetical protein